MAARRRSRRGDDARRRCRHRGRDHAPNLRAFWWTVGALLDAIAAKGLASSYGVKQLVARIDVQIRRVAEGSTKVADRLRREVLYYVAVSAPVTPSVREVQRVFRLSTLIPSAEVLSADVLRLEPLLRQAREQMARPRTRGSRFTSGRAENLPKLKQTMSRCSNTRPISATGR